MLFAQLDQPCHLFFRTKSLAWCLCLAAAICFKAKPETQVMDSLTHCPILSKYSDCGTSYWNTFSGTIHIPYCQCQHSITWEVTEL
uniref:Putative secreted protein ovary overexpressed n=1 Tax=Rhipicephalus microplus TaxID=6941 RepID=A0A6M2DBQ1_RHIMP